MGQADELVHKVKDRESFFAFLEALSRDREMAVELEKQSPSTPYGPDAGGWENVFIEDYLEAALQWAKDSHWGVNPDSPSWHDMASFLIAGKYYE